MIRRSSAVAAAILLALMAAGCSGTGTSPATPSLMASAALPAPTGAADSTGGAAGCAGAIAEFEKVVTSDVQVGHLNRPVYERITADLTSPKASCATGKDAQALTQLATIRSRYGYP